MTNERSLKGLMINKVFQFKFLSYFLILFCISTLSLYSTTYLFFWNLKNRGLRVGIPEGHVFYQFLLNQKHDLDILFISLAVFNLITLIIVGFFISHRIAGPLKKLELFLGNPSDGEKLKFRDKDFFKELETVANQLKEQIK